MICDWDDFCEDENRLDLLHALHDANPAFRCTLFSIPGRGSASFWNDVPDWCELAVHGWMHPDPHEAEHWSYLDAVKVLSKKPLRFSNGFKAPGWQVNAYTYRALMDFGWWIADHYDNDWRRPRGIRSHVISRESAAGVDPEHWHGHIGNVCGNGIEETFDVLLPRVADAESFQFISEVVEPW